MEAKILGLRTCIYNVSSLGEAKSWFSKAFDSKSYFDKPFYVGFNIGGFELGLLPNEGQTKDKSDGLFTYWGVEDIDKMYQKLINLEANEHEAPHIVGGEILVACVKDSWNNIMGIIYNLYFQLKY